MPSKSRPSEKVCNHSSRDSLSSSNAAISSPDISPSSLGSKTKARFELCSVSNASVSSIGNISPLVPT